MWTEILGALAIVAIVFFGQAALPAVPRLVDALCDRIRYGVQDPAKTADDAEQAPAAAPTQQVAKPVATPTAKTAAPQGKQATQTQRAAAA
jgi:Sec-independent protein translocase protein TatA